MKTTKQKGFTLIELLVVIAIIGLLSSLAVVSLSDARDKANDAKVKSDMAQFRIFAAIQYDNGIYTSTGTATGDDMVIGDAVPALLPPACSDDYPEYNVAVSDDGKEYAAWGDLCSAEGDFCVDSTGQAKVVEPSIDDDDTVECP